ncbi:ubiquitin carboxyl-terminal hydrolase isozyme L3 [Homalodisca vitripennis]|nr:ubiquitin carboxyl-terminal hydrolase isozyme L3 [Homalodisca vitripennis]
MGIALRYWDPCLFTFQLLVSVGVPEKWQIVDVYGLDQDLLAVVPRPVVALIFLFPTSDKYEEHRISQEGEVQAKGQTVSPDVYYMKQFAQNACGTIALLHSIGNNLDKIQLGDGCLKQFFEDTKQATPEERGEMLMKNAGVINAHQELAQEGQTEAPSPNEPVNFHFVALVCKDGDLYELDGRKSFPINHGPTTPDSLLEDGAKVIREYTSRDPDDIRFTVVALTATD